MRHQGVVVPEEVVIFSLSFLKIPYVIDKQGIKLPFQLLLSAQQDVCRASVADFAVRLDDSSLYPACSDAITTSFSINKMQWPNVSQVQHPYRTPTLLTSGDIYVEYPLQALRPGHG